ncbi:MAG: hypothetical protein MRY79_08600 [Alphaproteobacteria bacterium]|nr:hypothetical protein [Alphaproteobacteria bacterium]
MNEFTKASTNTKDIEAFLKADTAQIADIFRKWTKEGIPDIENFVQDAISQIAFTDQSKKAIMAAAKLAAEPNDNAYHGNEHFLQVFCMTYTLGHHAVETGRFTKETFGLLLTAALIHDYKHDAQGNKGEQFRLEKLAFDSAREDLAAYVSKEDLKIIKAFVLTTDVSKDFSDPNAVSPAESLKWYLSNKDIHSVFDELKILITESTSGNDLVDAALTLQDSDLASAHLDVESSHQSGRSLAKELGNEYDPKNQIFFMDKICHRRCFSSAGREIIQPCLNKVMKAFGMTEEYPKPARV